MPPLWPNGIVEQNEDRGPVIGDGQIDEAIAVGIAHGHGARARSRVVTEQKGFEVPRAVAQQQADTGITYHGKIIDPY